MMSEPTLTTPGWERALEDADLIVRLPGDVPLMFRRLPIADAHNLDREATFWMGSRGEQSAEEPRHRVRITQPFYLGIVPVTQHQWRAVAEAFAPKLTASPSAFKGELHPVEKVSWEDAIQWCQALQASELSSNLVDHHGRAIAVAEVTLPTEAQWEYACRAGTETEYHTGDGAAALADAGWYAGNSNRTTHPVGRRQANDFGLYDMHGNVDEWCRDVWDKDAYKHRSDGASDPEILGDAGSDRVFRGGSWNDGPWICRAAYRYRIGPTRRIRFRRFRVCLVSGPCPASNGAEPSSEGVARRDGAAKPQ